MEKRPHLLVVEKHGQISNKGSGHRDRVCDCLFDENVFFTEVASRSADTVRETLDEIAEGKRNYPFDLIILAQRVREKSSAISDLIRILASRKVEIKGIPVLVITQTSKGNRVERLTVSTRRLWKLSDQVSDQDLLGWVSDFLVKKGNGK